MKEWPYYEVDTMVLAAADRAYEDTGLTPGEVKSMQEEHFSGLEMAKLHSALMELKKYQEADKDGRLVVHGRWEMRPTGMVTDTGPEYKAYCTVCNEPNKQYQPPFCPHCGAKMDGGADHAAD